MPMVREMVTGISGKEINPLEVNPDDIVALGAAIYGSSPEREDPGPEIVEIATHNLGLVTFNEQNEKCIHVMIPKMTQVPCEKEDRFGTVEDEQEEALIEVVQVLEHNRLYDEILQDVAPNQAEQEQIEAFEEMYKLGECLLTLPPGLSKGSPIDVTYEYNSDQILHITAKGPNETTANVTIERKTLSDEEVREAKRHLQRMEVE